MRAVVQRCDGASVVVEGVRVGGFEGPGLTLLVGVTRTDTAEQARKLAAKAWGLRLFDSDRHAPAPESAGSAAADLPRELSASDLRLPLLVISQFTLYGRTAKGRRPTWEDAAPRPQAEPLVDEVVAELRRLGADVSTGVFGAYMSVALTNDGPFTVLLEV